MSQFFTKVYTTREKRPSLKALVVLSNVKPSSLSDLIIRKDISGFKVEINQLDPDLYRVYLTRTLNDVVRSGMFLLDISQPGAWVIFTNDNTYYVKHVLESLLNKLYPEISRVYFNIIQMRNFVNRIKEEYEGRSTFTSFTIRRTRKDWKLNFGEYKKEGTLILYEKDAENEIIKLSKDYNLKIIRLDFTIQDEGELIYLKSNINRNGKCSLVYGDFNSFYYNVVLKIIEYAKEWRNFYSNRERNIIENMIYLNPYSIQYTDEFSTFDLYLLSDKIKNSYSCSIIHDGNPYFVANICDYEEGSSFGLTVLGSKITVTPITRGTAEANWKLTETIQQILGDGEIVSV